MDDIDSMFHYAPAFNQDIGRWNTSACTEMDDVFYGATSFNQDIGNWDVSRVEKMDNMFRRATSFNQDIGRWDVSKVDDMDDMFQGATSFNQELTSWTPDLSGTDGRDCRDFAVGATAWLANWTPINGATNPLNGNPPLSPALLTAGCGLEQ